MKFKDLDLHNSILKNIELEGYEEPSTIQKEAIPHILKGRDILACAQTGTGKTAAFAWPLINDLLNDNNYNKNIKVLILTPTRELALQIRDSFRKYGRNTNLKCSVIFGGVNQRSQVDVLRKGVDVLVATPGRLLDLINQRHVRLNNLKTLVLDEADTMLDMGFIHDVKKIINYIPIERQTLLFSATISKEVTYLAKDLLKDPVTIKVNPEILTLDKIDQSVYFVDKDNKSNLLLDLLKDDSIKSVLVFVRTKYGADKLSERLTKSGINSTAIHSNKSQNARLLALKSFKCGQSKVLVATDIAARGIDIVELSHVINYELPEKADSYIHRIGRTGRAGLSGSAISFCNIQERKHLRNIEISINQTINIINEHNYPMKQSSLPYEPSKPSKNLYGRRKKRDNNASGRFNRHTSKRNYRSK